MKRSIAVIIFNEESDKRQKLKEILDTFHCLNMTLKVLVNKTAEEIQDAVVELTMMNDEDILDIIFVIYAKQFIQSDRQFLTVDHKIMNIYDNIIYYLLEIRYFEEKQKIIILNVSGNDNRSNLITKYPKKDHKCISYGSNVVILLSFAENFIETVFPKLTKDRNLSTAIQGTIVTVSKTFGDVKLSAASSSSELTSEFHEFVIG